MDIFIRHAQWQGFQDDVLPIPKPFLQRSELLYGSASRLLGRDCVEHARIGNNAGMFGVVIGWCCGGTPVVERHIPFIFDPISSYASRKSMGA